MRVQRVSACSAELDDDAPLVDGQPNPAIKCQQISGGDGFATMADGTQTYLFAFGPLSGMVDILNGLPGTTPASIFNTLAPVDPGVSEPNPSTTFNGAVGLTPDPEAGGAITGLVDPRPIMDVGVLNGSHPGPLMAVDEDDEFFLTLTNVGQIMRPDLFEQHTVHFHGYPNASAFFDGVPDASAAINIPPLPTTIGAGSTYFCTATLRRRTLQMGMWDRSTFAHGRTSWRQRSLYAGLQAAADVDECDSTDILCSNPPPPADNGATRQAGKPMPQRRRRLHRL
jgi:hypothetical protein